ncbi:MAG TPA: GntR family transcriptional regulator [Jiangellaceae bacterium]|nr:GntR family transcriptional regulator [Jiangellaceae bacterium]
MSSISSISLITSLSRPAAPYLQIADHYRELIATGVLRSGDRLPTVIQMATTWRVSPGTAHKAVRRLRGEGLVRTTRQGTTVQEEMA